MNRNLVAAVLSLVSLAGSLIPLTAPESEVEQVMIAGLAESGYHPGQIEWWEKLDGVVYYRMPEMQVIYWEEQRPGDDIMRLDFRQGRLVLIQRYTVAEPGFAFPPRGPVRAIAVEDGETIFIAEDRRQR